MAGFDLSDVLAAARGIPGAREDGGWRCVVYLSAYDWMSGWLRAPRYDGAVSGVQGVAFRPRRCA